MRRFGWRAWLLAACGILLAICSAPQASAARATPLTDSPSIQPEQTPAPAPSEAVPTWQPAQQLVLPTWQLVMALAWSPDSTLLAAAVSERLLIYSIPDLQIEQAIPAGGWVNELDYHPAGRLLAAARQDGSVLAWELPSARLHFSIPAHKKAANSVAFSPDGAALASSGNDGMARIWSSVDGAFVGELIGGAFAIPAVVYNAGGEDLAIANNQVVRVRNTTTQRFTQTLRSPSGMFSLARSPDGASMAGGLVDGSLLLWDLESGQVIWQAMAVMPGSHSYDTLVWQVDFSPGGRWLASSGGDGVVQIWDVSSGQAIARLHDHSRAVCAVAFSPDGRWLASGGLDGRINLYAVPSK